MRVELRTSADPEEWTLFDVPEATSVEEAAYRAVRLWFPEEIEAFACTEVLG